MAAAADPQPLPLGIMSTAVIAKKNIEALKAARGVAPACVASRDADRARRFAEETGVENSCGSYEAMLADERIKGVYIPLPTVLHAEWVAKSVIAGKHVLVEKPVARNAKELNAMLDECVEADLAFMDGVMFAHHDRLPAIRKVLDDGAIGEAGARAVNSVFCFRGNQDFFLNNIRVKTDGDPLGCLGDLGWYNVRLSLWAFKEELPVEVRGVILAHTEGGVPISFSGSMKWADDQHTTTPAAHLGVGAARTATFFCSFTHALQERATISGDAGFIEIDDFVIPFQRDTAQFTVVTPQPKYAQERTVHTVSGCVQEVKMWEDFAQLIAGSAKDRQVWMRAALANQLVIDALLQSAHNVGAPVKPDPENLLARFSK